MIRKMRSSSKKKVPLLEEISMIEESIFENTENPNGIEGQLSLSRRDSQLLGDSMACKSPSEYSD
jgi:hypothetical protein